MNLTEARKRIPELEGLTDGDAIEFIQRVYYPDVDRSKIERHLGYTPPPPPKPERSAVRAAGDLGLQFAGGAVTGVRMMTDLLGADNVASRGLRNAEDALQALQSAAAKADQQEIAAIMKEAEGKGFGDQVWAGVRAFGTAPAAMIAQALGTSLPTLATAAIPGVGPAAVAARMGAAGAIGAGQGAGNIKGSIYEEVKASPLAGETPEQTEARAIAAQSYNGQNADQIALGGALGAFAGSTGIERAAGALRHGVTRSAPGMLGRVGMGALTEAAPEVLQGGQEKFATNTALAREGFDVDPWSGVVAGGTMEGLAGAATGGLFGIPNPAVNEQRDPAKEAGDLVRKNKVPESGPMTRAGNAGTEMVARQAEADVAAQAGATLTGADAASLMRLPENPLLSAAQEMQAERQGQSRADAALARMERQNVRDMEGQRDFSRTPAEPSEAPSAQPEPDLATETTPDAAAGQALDAGAAPAVAQPDSAGDGAAPREGGAGAVVEPGQPGTLAPLNAAESKAEWQTFPPETKSMNLPRAEMPQVKAEHRGALVNFLNARGVEHEAAEVSADTLKPTQAEYSLEKVKRAQEFSDTDRSILVSSDGYVVDGHHQWLARGAKGEPVKVIRLKAPIKDLLPLVREFPSSTVDESTANVPNETQAAQGDTTAAPTTVETPAPARGDGAPAAGVPDARGTADAQADGVAPTTKQAGNPARDKALQRIERGTAYFGTDEKAQAFLTKFGLGDTHEAVQAKPGRFEVRARAAQAPVPATAADSVASAFTGKPDPRNSAPLDTLDGFKVGDKVRIPNRTFGEGTIQTLFTREVALAMNMARVVREDGKTLDILTSELEKIAPAAAAAPAPAEKPAGIVGRRADGVMIREDERGVRWYTKDGVRHTETVSIRPTRQGMQIERGELKPEFMTAEEVAARAPANAEKPAAAQDVPPTAPNFPGPYARWRDANFSERQQMLRAAGYTDVDQNRVLSGTDWSQLTDPVRRALVAEPKASTGQTAGQRRPKGTQANQPGDTGQADAAAKPEDFIPAPDGGLDYGEITPEMGKPAVSANTIFTEDAAAKARAILKKKLGTLNSGIDPELLQAGITLAGYHIEKGARTFAAYARAMLADLGDGVKPYLKSWYMGVKYDPRASAFDGMDSAATVEASDLDNLAEPADTGKETRGDDDAARTLDGPGPSPLEGAPAQDVQATAEAGPAGDAPARSGRGDQRADAEPDVAGVPAPRGVGDHEGAVPVPARRTRKQQGSAGERRTAVPEGNERQPSLLGDDGRGDRGGEGGRVGQPGAVEPPAFKPTDFTIEEDFALGEGGQKTKFRNNVAALRLLQTLESEQRHATPDEQAVLARYVGWGGLPQAFDPDNADWKREHDELRALLDSEAYDAARRSTRYAHYTSRTIIQGMYDALKRFGFTGGKVLEPGAGVGNFMGLMPADLRSGTRMTGVEREPIAAGIARHLYPNQNMQLQDFTQFQALDGYFDAVIGNPPFAADGLVDQSGRKHLSGMAVHDYFFAKSIDMLREGGVFAAVVSNGFMDKAGDRARRYIGERTKLLGAIRLPNNAFAANANTEVTTDIVFLQKLPETEWGSKAAKADLKRWMGTTKVDDPKGGAPVSVNQYFADHPEMMLGEYGRFGTMYGPDQPALVARSGQDTGALLRQAIDRLPEGVYEDAAVLGTDKASNDIIEALRDPSVQEGGFYVEDGKLYQRMPDRAGETSARLLTPATQWTEKTTLGEARHDRLVQLAGLRRTLRSLLAAELSGDKAMDGLRKTLNEQYDAYVAKHSRINDASTAQVFDDDPDFPLLAALELNYARGMGPAAAKAAGIKPYKSKADKAPIFARRVIEKRQPVTKAETPEDALNVSLAERGRIDAGYIGQLLGRPADEVLGELTKGDKPALFVDPVTGEHVLRDAYLSGNVRKKLAQAKLGGLERNVRALMEVQPEDVGAHEISARIGAPWVPADVYEDFIKNLLGDGTKASVTYVPSNSSFMVSVTPGSDVSNSSTYGTSRMKAEDILPALLNNRSIKVMDKDLDGKSTLNKEATDAANEKAADIKAKFADWIFSDPDRSEVLVRAYNDANNNYVTRVFDGSRMEFPGKVPDAIIKFRRHQRNAIARIVQDRTALLDHVVGAGKTFTVVAAAMELRRTGLAKKPLIAVPNHLVKQWAADFYRLYPGANVLTATKKDFERANRRRFLAKIATGDWDAVVIAHSSFGFIKPDPEFESIFNQSQIDHIVSAIQAVDEADSDKSSKRRTVKQLEAMKERLENRIKSLREKPVDDLLDFKQIGVDQLFVDEAHLFKNLMFSTKMQNVQGLGDSKGSQRAYDMYVKAAQVYAQNGREQGVVFATGTPVSNTLAEMYHMMRYLMPGAMNEHGFESFDAWANTFASVDQVWMQKTSGDGYKASDRLASFNNAPELLKMFDQVSDTVTMDDIKEAYAEENDGKEFPLPKLKGGRRTPVSLAKSDAQDAYMKEIADRALALERRKGPPKKGEDNYLTIMGDARKAAMDIRLVDLDRTEREPGARIDRASDEVMARYRQHDAVKGTQLVFSDLGTPLSSAKKEMKEYEELRARIDVGQDAEVQAEAAIGDEAAMKKIEEAEEAQAELDAKGPDWIDSIKAALRGFSVYDDFKKALIEKGIPENEIAFIHDYNTDDQKAGLYRRVNAGHIRVLLGSTQKLGAGTNVQERLVALHHLDVPWKPSDVEQREGRIIRQGNKLADTIPGFEVEILAYVTQDTLDMRMWQTQEVKLKMINQLRTRQVSREIDNPFEQAEMSAGEMQAAATGNMDLLREIQLRTDVKRLEQRKRSFDAQRNDLVSRRKRAERNVGRLPEEIAEIKALAGPAMAYFRSLEDRPFSATINGEQITNRPDAEAKLRELVKAHDQALADRKTAAEAAGEKAGAAHPEGSGERAGEALAARDAYLKDNAQPKMAVEFNGKTYGSKVTLGEAMVNHAGDREPIAWDVGGETYARRSQIASAIEEAVVDAGVTDTVREVGTIGGFKVTVEGNRDKYGHRLLDIVLERDGRTVDAQVMPAEKADGRSQAESVIRAVERALSGLPDKLQFAEYDLRKAKRELTDLDKTTMPDAWPDQEKLEKARADHKEVLQRLAGEPGQAAGDDVRLSLSASTQTAYEGRIDALFAGAKAERKGAIVLDRSDVMGLLGHADVPLVLNESHVANEGRSNHPEMTAAVWKKVPEWIENPAAVYTDPKHPGRLTIIAPQRLAGYPVVIAIEPSEQRSKSGPDHLLITAFAKTTGGLPAFGYLAGNGRLLYADTKKAPEVWRRIGDNPRPNRPTPGAKKILTEKNLAGWRKANPSMDARETSMSIDAQGASGDTEAHGPATQAHRNLVRTVRESLSVGKLAGGRTHLLDAVTPGTGPRGRAASSVAKVALALFGREVVYVKFEGKPLFSGMVSSSAPDKIFINIDSKTPLMAVLGHELLHELARNNPGVYAELSTRLDKLLKDDGVYTSTMREAYLNAGLNPENTDFREELEADIVGDNFMDPEFWQAMAAEQPGLFKQVANAIIKWLNGVIEKLGKIMPFETERFLVDTTAARDAVAHAMRQFSANEVGAAAGRDRLSVAQDVDARFSIASPAGIQKAIIEAVPEGVMQRLEDLTASQRGFNRWWHRTVGTQLHKAKTNKDFGQVFYAVQDFMKDTSRMATLAADLAPDLLPQVDSLRDVKKLAPQLLNTKARKADLKTTSDALFDGTLRYTRNKDGEAVLVDAESEETGGLVWTDAELRERGLNDKAIAMYRQARDAIDQSLDSLMAADVYRQATFMQPEMLAGDPAEHASLMERMRRAAASESPLSGVSAALRALNAQGGKTLDQIRRLRESVDAEEDGPTAFLAKSALRRASDLMNQINQARETIQAKLDRISELKAKGYAPLMRFGPYTVDVVDGSGNRVFFGMYETQFESNRAARRFREQGLTVSQGVKAQREFETLKGVSPETAMLFADMLGVERDAAMQTWLQNALAEQSALKRHIRRKGIEGFDDDASRVVAAFITSNSRAGARALHSLRIQERVENVRDGDVKDEAIALAQYVDNPREEAQAVRSLLFVNYIGGSIASALVNLTQTLVQTFPYLAQFGGAASSAKRVAAAMKLALGKIEDADLAAAVKRAEDDGVIKPQEVFQLQAEASRSLGSDLRVRAGLALWGSFFQAAEVFNRRVAFIAAYQTAKEQKIANPFAFAENAVDETQGVFNKGNRPNWARGPVGATLFTFKTFTIQYVEFLKRLPPKEKALALAVLVVISGMRGIPFAEDAEDIVDTVAQGLGYSFTTREAMHRFAANTLGRDFADFLTTGASGTGLLPFDVSQRLGMGDLLPGTGLLKPSETRKEDQVLEVFGVAGSFVRDALKGEARPVAIRNVAKGWEMYSRGIYTDTRGRKVMDVDATDAAFKAIGLQPAKVAAESRAVSTQYEHRALFTKVKGQISEQIALGMFEGDRDKVKRAHERLAAWNEKNPDQKIVLSSQGIRKRVVEMRKDRAERFVKSTPRELRGQAREALAE